MQWLLNIQGMNMKCSQICEDIASHVSIPQISRVHKVNCSMTKLVSILHVNLPQLKAHSKKKHYDHMSPMNRHNPPTFWVVIKFNSYYTMYLPPNQSIEKAPHNGVDVFIISMVVLR